MTRLIDPSQLPGSLWDRTTNILHLPHALAQAYVALVDQRGLRSLADSRDRSNPPVGGLTQELADTHFAQAFDGSAARALLALLDPHDDLPNVSDTFIRSMAGNSLCIIDAPCGAAATSYAFLTAIADLRAAEVLPRLPLDVSLVGGDLSAPAIAYARDIHGRVAPHLARQAIYVSEEFHSWDATCAMSTTRLIRRAVELSANERRRLVLVANFSGFLKREGKRAVAERQIEELFRYLSGPGCAAIWIEPQMNAATHASGVFQWLRKKVSEAWRHFMSIDTSEDAEPHFTSSAHFLEPLDVSKTPSVRIAVMRMALEDQT